MSIEWDIPEEHKVCLNCIHWLPSLKPRTAGDRLCECKWGCVNYHPSNTKNYFYPNEAWYCADGEEEE